MGKKHASQYANFGSLLERKVTKSSRLNLSRYSVPSGSLSRLKLASLRQQTLRALTSVSAPNAHQLRPK